MLFWNIKLEYSDLYTDFLEKIIYFFISIISRYNKCYDVL